MCKGDDKKLSTILSLIGLNGRNLNGRNRSTSQYNNSEIQPQCPLSEGILPVENVAKNDFN